MKKGTKKTAIKSKQCDCFDKVNKQLEPQGLELDHRVQVNFTGSNQITIAAPLISLQWRDPKRKKKPTVMFCNYCPFCGKKKE
jgi:hypothetical protein